MKLSYEVDASPLARAARYRCSAHAEDIGERAHHGYRHMENRIALSDATIGRLPANVRRFRYDRAAISPGIAHLSVGNFHRAHEASYIDALLENAKNHAWGLWGIGIVDDSAERRKAQAFQLQDSLYTLTRYRYDGNVEHRVIGSIVDYTFGPQDPEAVLKRLGDPSIRIVTMTITEGGYNQDTAVHPERPISAFGYLVEGLRRRRDRGTPPFTVLSCDNLRNNGRVAAEAVVSHARALDPGLADWILEHVTFPNCMVDGITPAVLAEDAQRIDAATGIDDLIPVFAEDYVNWVIEDAFCAGRPPLEEVGVRMVRDVSPYELAKLRMLNASHSMLAYPAQLSGHHLVSEVVADPVMSCFLRQFMERDVIPGLTSPPGVSLQEYKDSIIARFSNPALPDQVERISSNGAVKLPIFLAPTVRHVLETHGDHRRIAFGLACFVRYLGGIDDRGNAFEPFEPVLAPAEKALALDADPRAALRMSMFENFGAIAEGAFSETFAGMRGAIARDGAARVLASVVDR